MRRLLKIFGALLVVGVVIAVALPGYADYAPRARVTAALLFIGKGREALELSCSNGTFASKLQLVDIGLPESDPATYIHRAELLRMAPNVVRVEAALTDIYGRPFFGLFPWKVIPQGSMLKYEFTCSTEK